MILPCLNLYQTKDEAFKFKNSWINTRYIFGGIHIRPNNPIAIIQVTNTPGGVNIEDWVVKVIDLQNENISYDISNCFKIIGYTNALDGSPQIIWQLANIPYDMGYRLVYIEVVQSHGEIFYSSPFRLTNIYADRISQFHYKEKRTEPYQSISFQTWFRQESVQMDLTTYYETSTQHTVTQAVKVNDIEPYHTEPMAFGELKLLAMVLRSPYLYVNQVRVSLFEAIDFPQAKASENFGTFSYTLSPNENDKLVVMPVPPMIKIHSNVFNNVFK